MIKKKVQKRVTEKQIQELKGFEDLIDESLEELEERDKKARKKDTEKYGEGHEIYNFLEKETDRLGAIDRFFGDQIPNKMKHPQIDVLITKQLKRRDLLREEIVDIICKDDSAFLNNFSRYNAISITLRI